MINRIINNRAKAPFIINIELTDYCPLHCKQCYKKLDYTSLDWDTFKNLVNEAKEIGVKKILLSGGEPLSYPHIFDAIQLIKENNMFVCMSTGGCGLNENVAAKLDKSGIDIIYISLNGSTREINELSRDGYDEALEAMRLLKNAGALFRVNWVARKDNIDDFPNLIALCQDNGASGIDILFNKPNMNGIIEEPLKANDFAVLDRIGKEFPDYVEHQSCFYQLDKYSPGHKKGFFSGCLAGRASMAVFADGEFSICPHIYNKEKKESIMTFWDGCMDVKNDWTCKLMKSVKV